MTTDDTGSSPPRSVAEPARPASLLPVLPALVREAPPSHAPEEPLPAPVHPPEQLGFHLRFEMGRALLALENRPVAPGIEIKRALFEVPDVAFPLDVSGGAQRFQGRRLTLRAIELSLSHAALFVPEKLTASGFRLVRERSRGGGLELLLEMPGPSTAVTLRARGFFTAVGEGGAAFVLSEIVGFGGLPRSRLEIARALLDALALPGGQPARAMVRRAEPFRAVLTRLLPAHGWKVPSLGDVRMHEAVLGKGELVLRAWARELPDGWKAPREAKRHAFDDAAALAVFADGLADANARAPHDAADPSGQDGALRVIDGLMDAGPLAPAVVPFVAELLEAHPRRRGEGVDLVRAALARAPAHLGVLSAAAELPSLSPAERAVRLGALGLAADAADEPWVAARAHYAAALLFSGLHEVAAARDAAEAAFRADPSLPETGTLYARVLGESGDVARALSVGRTALERTDDADAAEALAIVLARHAAVAESADSARMFLRRALRRRDRADALEALIDVEVAAREFDRASDLLTRLLLLVDKPDASGAPPVERLSVERIAARIALARGDLENARMHLLRARDLAPDDAAIALELTHVLEKTGDVERAYEALLPALVADDATDGVIETAVRLLLRRDAAGDTARALTLLGRVPRARFTASLVRLDAEARAAAGETRPLAELLMDDARALDDAAARVPLALRAARGFLAARAPNEAAAALAMVLPRAPREVASVLGAEADDTLADALGANATVAAAGAPDPGPWRQVAAELAALGKPRAALRLIAQFGDRQSIALRADFAGLADDVELEIAERTALLAYSNVDDEPSAGTARLDSDAALHQRLGLLHLRVGGAGAAAAADAFAAAAALPASDAFVLDEAAWLHAAIKSGDGARLARVLVRPSVDLSGVSSDRLRAAIGALSEASTATDVSARIRLTRTLADRHERIEDTETHLQEVRLLDHAAAARTLVDAAVQYERADWLLEAAGLVAERGPGTAGIAEAVAILRDVPGPLRHRRDVLERRFALACTGTSTAEIDAAADALLSGPLAGTTEMSARGAVQRARALRLREIDTTAAEAGFGAWLGESPAEPEPLLWLVPRLLVAGDLARAVTFLDAAVRAAGADAAAEVGIDRLLHDAAVLAARAGRVDEELRARELLVGLLLVPPDRLPHLLRLADLFEGARAYEKAAAVLDAAAEIEPDTAERAALLIRVADVYENHTGDLQRAAHSLQTVLSLVPDDVACSARLLAVHVARDDQRGVIAECIRRADRLSPSEERSALLVRAADTARSLVQRDGVPLAVALYFRALRSEPFSPPALARLVELARTARRPKLQVRAYAAAAKTNRTGASAARYAAEAGAFLAGVLGRSALAARAFRFAAAAEPGNASHARVLVDIYRALGDGERALAVLNDLAAQARGSERALLEETRADVLEHWLHDDDGAITARRAALALDPTQAVSAHALARQLRANGNGRAAVDVDRAFADAALPGDRRAAVYVALAERAENELRDNALAAELANAAVSLDDVPASRVRAARLAEALGRPQEAVDYLAPLLQPQEPPVAMAEVQLVAIARKKAALEADGLARLDVAARTLADALMLEAVAASGLTDLLLLDLAQIEERRDDPVGAARVLSTLLEQRPTGSAAAGGRAAVLERIGCLLDDAPQEGREPQRAFELLLEASGLTDLGRAGELRLARLAGDLGRDDIVVASLRRLMDQAASAEERVAFLGRIALACERLGDRAGALAAWQERAERLPGDADALLAVERLGDALGRRDEARAAALALVRLEAGDAAERHARLVFLARDARDVRVDNAAATRFFEQAAALAIDDALRREALAVALTQPPDGFTLGLLDGLSLASLSAIEQLRRAEVRARLHPEGENAARIVHDVVDVLDRERADRPVAIDDDLIETLRAGAKHDPAAAVALWCMRRDAPSHTALRAALVPALVADARVATALLEQLADALPDDLEVAVLCAERERAAGETLRAADRLFAIAERVEAGASIAAADSRWSVAGDTTLLRSEAVGALLDSRDAAIALTERMSKVRPLLAARADLRQRALVVLRDAEAWEAVVGLLEDALPAASGAERRALTLELVSVLRHALGDVDDLDSQRKAARFLEGLVEADPDDREAWGELLECLDTLGERERLADALGRRAERAIGIERRELVRRRTSLLLELGRGVDALPLLQAVRSENRTDGELKGLERRIHDATGAAALAQFLASELRASGELADAEALLRVDRTAIADSDIVAAYVVAVRAARDDDAVAERASHVVQSADESDDVAMRAATVAAALADPTRAVFVQASLRAAAHRGDQTALALVDALRLRGLSVASSETEAHLARALRRIGPVAAARDPDFDAALERLAQSAVTIAARTRRPTLIRPVAIRVAEGLAANAGAEARMGLLQDHAGIAAALHARADAQVRAQATAANVVGLVIRAAHDAPSAARATLAAERLNGDAARRAAQRACHLRLAPWTLRARAVLAAHLTPSQRKDELRTIGLHAEAAGDAELALTALDAYFTEFDDAARTDTDAVLCRADLADRGSDADLAQWAQLAADVLVARAAAGSPADPRAILRWRRATVQGLLRFGPSGETAAPTLASNGGGVLDAEASLHPSAIGRAIHALVATAPDDAALVREAVGLAEAAGLFDVVDALMAETASRSADVNERRAAILERAERRLQNGREAKAAFDVLIAGGAVTDPVLRDAAYQLAARHGLVSEQLAVVDDVLAQAGLTALLGDTAAALLLLRGHREPAALVLAAELARDVHDVDGELAALVALIQQGLGDRAQKQRVVRRLLERGRVEDAVATLMTFAPAETETALLVDVAAAVASPDQAGPLADRLAQAADTALPSVAQTLLEQAGRLAAIAGAQDAAFAHALRAAELADDDESWLTFLRAWAASGPVTVVDARVDALVRRPRFVQRIATGLDELALPLLQTALARGAAREIADAFVDLEVSASAAPLIALHAAALEQLGALPGAAERHLALWRLEAPLGADNLRQAAALFARADAPERAVAVVVAAAHAAPDAAAREDVLSVLRALLPALSADWAARAARALADFTGTDADVAGAMESAAHASPAVALAVARWRLPRARSDARLWDLVTRYGEERQQLPLQIQRAIAERSAARIASGTAPPDVVALAALLDRQLPASVLSAWRSRPTLHPAQEARRGSHGESQRAWQQLAEDAARRGLAADAARLFARAGATLADAPLDVRLIADPALRDPRRRAQALITALATHSETEQQRAAFASAASELDARGYVTARERSAARLPRHPLVHANDDAVGASALGRALSQMTSRWPSAAERTTLAALFAEHGLRDASAAADPRITRAARPAVRWPVEKARDLIAAGDASGALAAALCALSSHAEQNSAERASAATILEQAAIDAGQPRLVDLALRLQIAFATRAVLADDAGAEANSAEQSARWRRRMQAQLWLLDPARALLCARLASAADPTSLDAARAWRDRAVASEAPRDEANALEALARLTADAEERRASAARRAALLSGVLGDAGAAVAAIDLELLQSPDRFELLFARAQALVSTGALAEAAAAFARAADAGTRGGAPSGLVVEALKSARSAWRDAGLGQPALEVAVRLAQMSGDDESIADAESTARHLDDASALAEVLKLRLEMTVEPKARRALVLERAHLLTERLAQRAQATALLEGQANVDPQDLAARLTLAAWYLEDRRILDAARSYEGAARVPGVKASAAAVAARDAAALFASLGDLARAAPLAQQALDAGVVDHQVLAVAEAWSRSQGEFAEVDALLGREIDLETDPRHQAHLWVERATVRRDFLRDAAAAKKAVLRALELAPAHTAALQMMRDEAARAGVYGPLRAALFAAADVVTGRQQADLLCEVAALDSERLQDARAADAAIDRALAVDPDNAGALVTKATLQARQGRMEGVVALLDRAEAAGATALPGILHIVRGDGLLLTGERDAARTAFEHATAEPETALRAWERLADLADGAQQTIALVDRALAAVSDPKLQTPFLRRGARAHASNGDAAAQAALLERILANDPGDTDAFRALRESAAKRRKLPALVPVMAAWARAAAGTERARRLAEYGAFLLDEAGDEMQARQVFEESLGLDADEPTALLRLADIAWSAHDAARALELLDRIQAAQWARDPTELLFRRASCAVALSRPDVAERLRAVLRLNARHVEALEMLIRHATAAGDDNTAEFALESLTAAISPREDPVRLASAFAELAQLRRRQELPADALVAAESALDLDPSNASILELAAFTRDAAGRSLDAAEAWRRLAALRTGDQRHDALRRRAAALLRAERHSDAADVFAELAAETDAPADHADHARVRALADAVRVRAAESSKEATAVIPAFAAAQGAVPRVATPADVVLAAAATPEAAAQAPEPPDARTSTSPFLAQPAAALDDSGAIPAVSSARVPTPAHAIPAAAPSLGDLGDLSAIQLEVHGHLERGAPQEALAVVMRVLEDGGGDPELVILGIEAAEKADDPRRLVELIEARLRAATHAAAGGGADTKELPKPEAEEVKGIARLGARAAKERLGDVERAAALLYTAHQADAEDIDVRLELTETYAQIPRLASHAVTGILQLLRRTPADPRVFQLAADLAQSQGQLERVRSMRAMQHALVGEGIADERAVPQSERAATLVPLDDEQFTTRVAPTGFGSALQRLLTLVAARLEVALAGEGLIPASARPLQAAPGSRVALAMETVERLLPGRAPRLFVGEVERLTVVPANIPTVILPVAFVGLGDAVLLAAIARATALVRYGATLAEVVKQGEESAILQVLHAAFAPDKKATDLPVVVVARVEKLLRSLTAEELVQARTLAATALAPNADALATLGVLVRAADRIALLVSGSLPAAFHVGALPTLLREPAPRQAALVQGSARALELAAFAARDNVWQLRAHLGLTAGAPRP